MKSIFGITVLLLVTLNCEGQRNSFLEGLFSGAQNLGSSVQGAIQAGISHGLQHLGNRGKPGHRPPPTPEPPADTVVVIIEEESPNQNRPQHHQPGYSYNKPNQHQSWHNHHRPHHHHYEHEYHHHHNHGGNNGNYGNHGHYGNGNYNPKPRPPNQGPNYGNNGYPDNNGNLNGNTPDFGETTGAMGIPTKPPSGNQNPSEQVTKKPGGDKPHLIPLNPNEYVYGGDNINVEPPKGEEHTSEKPTPAAGGEDDSYPIDIRFGDKK